ncbi:hypothetical protein AB4Y36_38180 [Paraburkholderia sp. BR10936]|uniref:hypothetical protein n=1 Tax=Paraburkholderia sp. BR10936 TaxID=3236993 RepID=UPI0034D378D1
MTTPLGVTLAPQSLFALLDALDAKGEAYSLVRVPAKGTCVLYVEIDGMPSEHHIELKPDGSWVARSTIVV